MGLGSTTKKIKRVANVVEEIYTKTNRLVEDVMQLREEFETTSQRVERMETELDRQREVLEAIAEAEGVDVESLLADAGDASADGSDPAAGNGDATESSGGGSTESNGGGSSESSGDGDAAGSTDGRTAAE